jgi:hypothetical protein
MKSRDFWVTNQTETLPSAAGLVTTCYSDMIMVLRIRALSIEALITPETS